MRSFAFAVLLTMFGSAAVVCGAAQSPKPETKPGGVPRRAATPLVLRIHEIPESGQDNSKGERDCSDTNPQCAADIKSTLEIVPDLEHLPNRPPVVSVMDPLDTDRRKQLDKALMALNSSLAVSRRIIAGMGQTPLPIPQLQSLSTQFAIERRNMMDAIEEYERLDPANKGLDHDGILSLPEVQNAFPSVTGDGDLGGFLTRKIEELNARSAARLRAAAAAGYEMKLGAFRVRKGADPMPIHLPNYDTYNTLSPSALPRITTNVSAAEAAENTAEVKATMELAAAAQNGLKDLVSSFRQQVETLRQKLQQQQAAITSVPASATSIGGMVRTLATNLTNLGTQQNNAALTKAGTDIAALGASIDAVTKTVADVNRTITTTMAGLANVTQGATSPDTVLRNVLGLANSGIADLTSNAIAAKTELDKISATLTTIEADVTAIGQNQAEATGLVARVRKELVDVLTAPLGQLQGLSSFIATVRTGANDAAPVLNLNAPEILTVSDIIPTRLEIPRTDPSDGDVIDIATQVFQSGKTTPIYEEHRSITVHFYGWHSGLSSGLVFVRAAKGNESNFRPEAAAVWRIGYTPRPGDKNSLGALRPGVGIHATTLHFNTSGGTGTAEENNTNNLQFGLGVSVHLFGDLIQTGYGVNLGVQKNRGYSYVGIGIMRVLRQLLSQRQ